MISDWKLHYRDFPFMWYLMSGCVVKECISFLDRTWMSYFQSYFKLVSTILEYCIYVFCIFIWVKSYKALINTLAYLLKKQPIKIDRVNKNFMARGITAKSTKPPCPSSIIFSYDHICYLFLGWGLSRFFFG